MDIKIRELDSRAIKKEVRHLAKIVADSVAEGAAISFMAPLSAHEAARFWTKDVLVEVAGGRRILFGAELKGELLGTVQVLTAMPPNQPHRCEIAKMIVHPSARRCGLGRALMEHAIAKARLIGKSLITLDTRTGDVAEGLYSSVGFEIAGVIPDFAWDPDGKAKHATTYMFRLL